MTAKEYYKSTRMVETRNWTLEMALNFAEEYAEALRKHAVISSVCEHPYASLVGEEHGNPKCLKCGKNLNEQTDL